MNDTLLDRDYQSWLRQFVQSTIGKEPGEMRAQVIEFLPTFIAKTDEDIRICVDTRDQALAELRKLEARIALHGEFRKDRKKKDKLIKHLELMQSLFKRIKAQVDHWESMRISFNIILPEIAGMSDSVTAYSSLSTLFPQLYSESMV